MLRYKFVITTCCGEYVGEVIFTLPVKADPWAYQNMAIERAGYNQFQCQQCWSPSYPHHTRVPAGYLVNIEELD